MHEKNLNLSTQKRLMSLLKRMCNDPHMSLTQSPSGDWDCIDGSGQSVLRTPDGLVKSLAARGLLKASQAGVLRASDEAISLIRRSAAKELPFLAQHKKLAGRTISQAGQARHDLIDLDESPVAQLARRRGKDGNLLLTDDQVEAANRLRQEFERAQMQPRLTMSYSEHAGRSSRRSGLSNAQAELSDGALSARLRVEAALTSVGPEFSGIVVDVCCFLKGLETVERDRQWPARSAKLVLSLALKALARHYGLSEEASGPDHSRAILHWGDGDYRPSIS